MVLSRGDGGMTNSSSSSGIYFQGDGQSQVQGNPQLNYGNSSNSMRENAFASMGLVSGDVSNTVLNSAASSGPSVGASSLVTDANSGLSGGPNLQRSASINTESYMRLPASPMSFSSNNISISGSSVMDGSVVQISSHQDPSSEQVEQRQLHQGASSTTSFPMLRVGQVQLPGGRVSSTFTQDPTSISQLQKKPRLDIKQEDTSQQQILQQLLQRQDPMSLQNPNPQLQALIHQQRLRQQQQQILQSMTPMQRVQWLQQQQQQQQQQQLQLQLRQQQLQQQGLQPASINKRPNDTGVCSRRLMQYLFHQRQCLPGNSYSYWKKFVAEYYSPRAKQRWCLSLYDNVGHHSLGVFPQAAMDAWHCDICGSKSGKGFEATFEVLPRLNEIKFSSGVLDEILYLELPRECRFPSGMMMVEYSKAVQETIYEQFRVVHEGRLRIIFTPDLKILTWEFCARRHDELLPRRLIAPQVNQMLQAAQKCKSSIDESGPDGVSPQDLQANNAMVVTAGRQLAKSLEAQLVNDFGLSKRYVRCLQIADVINSMNDLMDFCREQKMGPIDGLKNFPRPTKTQEMEGLRGLPTDRVTLSKLMTFHPGLNTQMNNNQHNMVAQKPLTGSAQGALALANYQNMLMRQNSNNSSFQPESSSSLNINSSPGPNSTFRGSSPGNLQQQRAFSGNNGLMQMQNQPQPSQGSQALQQQMIQRYLQNIMDNNSNVCRVSQQPMSMQGTGGSGAGLRNTALAPSANGPGNAANPCESNKTVCHNESSAGSGKGSSDLPLTGEMVHDVIHEFTENGFFDSDLDEINYSWKD